METTFRAPRENFITELASNGDQFKSSSIGALLLFGVVVFVVLDQYTIGFDSIAFIHQKHL